MGAPDVRSCSDSSARRRGHTGELSGATCRSDLGHHIFWIVEGRAKIDEIDRIGCQTVLIAATTEEILEWKEDGLRSRSLSFPARNGLIVWPRFVLSVSLFQAHGQRD
jgi:hypothetical protein